MLNLIPTLAEIQALNGRFFSMLNPEELDVLDFYFKRGRTYDVAISILSEADPAQLLAARSAKEANAILKQADKRVTVTIGPNVGTVRSDLAH